MPQTTANPREPSCSAGRPVHMRVREALDAVRPSRREDHRFKVASPGVQRPAGIVLYGEAILAHHNLAGCRYAKVIHGEHIAVAADIAMPTLRHAGFDRELGTDRWRQHRVTVFPWLSLEPFPARHWNDARLDFFSSNFCRAATISATSEPLAIRIRSGLPFGASARMYAPRRKPSAAENCARSRVGTSCRVSTSATGRSRVFRATRQATAVSLASPGRMTIRRGIARRLASCSPVDALNRPRPAQCCRE